MIWKHIFYSWRFLILNVITFNNIMKSRYLSKLRFTCSDASNLITSLLNDKALFALSSILDSIFPSFWSILLISRIKFVWWHATSWPWSDSLFRIISIRSLESPISSDVRRFLTFDIWPWVSPNHRDENFVEFTVESSMVRRSLYKKILIRNLNCSK